jgi:hypothetical protein
MNIGRKHACDGRAARSGVRRRPISRAALSLVALALLASGLTTASAGAAEPEKFGFETVGASSTTNQAGAHPNVTLSFSLIPNPNEPPAGGSRPPYARTKDLHFAMPAGLLGNLNAVDECSVSDFMEAFTGSGCPITSQVGIARTKVFPLPGTFNDSIYLLPPPTGGTDIVARLGLYAGPVATMINVRVRSDSDYGLTGSVEGAPANLPLVNAKATLWGVPGDSAHNTERLLVTESEKSVSPPRPWPASRVVQPFLTNPTTCGEPLPVGFSARTYALPESVVGAQATLPAITGCEAIKFEPSFDVTPTSHSTETPTGLDVTLTIPQDESLAGLATSQMRGATVALPPGMTIAPGAGDGLQACSAELAGYQATHVAECPLASQIGTAEFEVPALREEAPGVSKILHGAIYQRTPEKGDQFKIWLVADEAGVHVAIPGDIHADPNTGELTNVFVDTPQVPVRTIKLHIKSGSRAPLSTPRKCGTYQTHFEFLPWSGALPATGDTPMAIDQDCNSGGFSPGFSAGSTNGAAGSFANFVMNVTRDSGQQNISGLNVTLPPGMLAKLAGVPLCGDGEASSGACPSNSQIGKVTVAAGPGSTPLWVPQPGKEPTAVYLAGPYKGAPYSAVVKVPAQAGPFDLGTVAVRAGLYVDLTTTQATVKSDPLPQFIEGVPTTYRDINVTVDRPNFTLNPTNCEPLAVTAEMTGSEGGSVKRSDPFRVDGCRGLPFKPKLKLMLRGPTRRAGHPSIKAILTFPPGTNANIARAQVGLPHSEFLDQGSIRTVCTQPQLKTATCPKDSIYGRAKAWTPLLDKPLEGPVYLGVGYGHKLPDLVADLNGSIRVLVNGKVDTDPQEGIRNTFETAPDAPVSKFMLELVGGKKKGLLENSENICKKAQRAEVVFRGQNGKRMSFKAPIGNECSKKKGRSKKGKGSEKKG